ncbi:MAG: MucR family transcriptional regulator [Candidatus Cloacimonetes bacterium]|nr:MucR family transcriptional regulator [Candidatus Cloacimonadota bacterium]
MSNNSYYVITVISGGTTKMSNLTELTAQIIAARAAKKDMSTEELQQEMQMVYSFLKGIESGDMPAPVTVAQEPTVEESKPQLTLKQAFKKDEVICMICNQGFKTLKRHLTMAHNLKPGEYRKQFNIPSTQSLAAKSYSDSRRQMALDKGLGAGLVKYRADKAAKKAVVPMVNVKSTATGVKVIAPVPVAKKKPSVPVVKVKAAVPAKVAKKK